tara:strand:+ start:97 stop:972 length:876 start_codon:yes stop_codon:yes gene_type:complete
MFDVVIPVYKTEPDYLREAINSVLNQTYTNFQIYISDGTPENHEWHSTKTLADYDDERIHIIQQEGKGIADARNQAGKMGNNPYIATLDSDDTWFELKLEYYKQLLDENPNLSIIWGEAQVTAELTSVKGETRKITAFGGICWGWSETLPQHRWFRVCWNPLMTSTQVYSRKIIETVGWWNPTLTMGEDTDLNVRILKEYPDAHQVESCVGTYRVHPTQTTKGGDSHGVESGIDIQTRPDTFDNMFRELKQQEEGIDEKYWDWLYKIVNSHRQPDMEEVVEFSLVGGRRFV